MEIIELSQNGRQNFRMTTEKKFYSFPRANIMNEKIGHHTALPRGLNWKQIQGSK